MVRRAVLAGLAALALLCGCSPGQGQAQTGLPKAEITVDAKGGPVRFTVEMATDDAAREKGLMFRTELGANDGMLFDFKKEGLHAFWMKNTILPLDMIFIRADGTISNIAENTIPYSEDAVVSSDPVQAVLEINGGRSRALGIAPGAKVHAKIFGNGP